MLINEFKDTEWLGFLPCLNDTAVMELTNENPRPHGIYLKIRFYAKLIRNTDQGQE